MAEVRALFAQADETNRQSEFTCNSHDDATARGTVELGDDQTGHANGRVELFRLCQRVLTLVGVEHQQHLVWCRGVHAAHHALDLAQLIHQMCLAV